MSLNLWKSNGVHTTHRGLSHNFIEHLSFDALPLVEREAELINPSRRILSDPHYTNKRAFNNLGFIQQIEVPLTFNATHRLLWELARQVRQVQPVNGCAVPFDNVGVLSVCAFPLQRSLE
jgi:hypothetical protein